MLIFPIYFFSVSNLVCGVCATVSPAAFTHQSRKYGISSCETCRKFISKTVKKLAVAGEKSPLNMVQCKKGDGTCTISPIVPSIRSLKASIKKRCPACWLKKCINSYRLPSESKIQIEKLLPANMQTFDNKSFGSSFQMKPETNGADAASKSTGINNLFGNSLSSCRRMLTTWTTKDATEGTEFRSFNSLSNPLAENNSKFGSSPQIVPNILEKPSIMSTNLSASLSTNVTSSKKPPTEPKETPIPKAQTSQSETNKKPSTNTNSVSTSEPEESTRLRSRKKDNVVTTVSTTSTITTTVTSASAGNEVNKRQRIDLKGPRVKHVCRSASIVLGQPIATFADIDENPILDTLDTPPRPESPNGIVEFEGTPAASMIAAQNEKQFEQNKQFGFNECADSTRLSPPATPIINDYDSESTSKEQNGDKSPSDNGKSDDASSTSNDSVKRSLADDAPKPSTRKVSRPANIVATTNNAPSFKKLNSFIRKQPTKPPIIKLPPMISIDFWENYDPAEVSQSGFGLIFSEEVLIKALCFLCGSCGQDPLMFCVCCCEPYHQYCVEDEYNLKQHISLDDTNASFMETSFIGAINAVSSSVNKLNWLCPRCTICYSCNMASGSKVKCQKCHKNYHSTCLGTSKRLLGADRPLICANCLKCKSCGTTSVSKFIGNLPMCSQCFKLRQKGNYCPLCQKCYEDNDFNIKMMECGDCHRWVHSKCEGLTDEQYNMLSVLPENIEFICKKCAKTNPAAATWRDAVSAEFKAGLLGVVKLLSKSRQACALLKLSPRKKSPKCRVCIQKQMTLDNRDDNELDEKVESDSYDFAASSSPPPLSIESNPYQSNKCYCSSSISLKLNTSQSLIDIKQKILANKYYSLADFNYDMNVVINAASCDELMTTYKEILSEAFPWFQNETKACTDALEEDMYDSCDFGQASMNNDEIDQQVPMIDVPDDIEEYFYQPVPVQDVRICLFCKTNGDGEATNESRMLYCGQNSWVHANCAMWSAEVFEEIDGSLQNVHSAISRGRMIKCSECGNKGATVGCNVRNCGEHYHFPCARKANCAFTTDKTVFCPKHVNDQSNQLKSTIETNFEVLRPVYVELDRKRKRSVNPRNVQFLIGSLHVKQLGKFVNKLSDRAEAIVPADFLCSRLYWSSKEPWKIVEYTIRTTIQSNLNIAMDTGRNFTVDHSNNLNKVQIGLAQIAKWHLSLNSCDENENLARQERPTKMINGHSEETNEEEPQSNADLLPPEIKDAIFEDLPHDILDGISMLDIFPKLMTYEDMVAMDTKNDQTLMNSDGLLRDTTTDDEASQNSQKAFDGESWTSTNMHAEDAMLSARSAAGTLKRNKSDLFARGAFANHQRATAWSNKLDSAISAKRRKMSRLDLRLPESVLLSLGRRKEEISNNISEITRQCLQSEEMKNKPFSWTAAKRFVQLNNDTPQQLDGSPASKNRFKISQLDGMVEDVSNDAISNHINFKAHNVKCERCHCTYRTQDSYNRHLQSCEPLSSTSESDSEIISKSPETHNQQQTISSNMILMNGQDYCNIPMLQQNNHGQQLFGTNLNQLAMQNSVQLNNGQSLPIASLQNGSLQMQGMFINPNTGTIQPQQSHVFAQPLTLGTLAQQPVFPLQNLTQNTTSQAQTLSLQHATSQNIQYQPQIISCSTANTSQVLTVTPSQQQNITTSNYASIKTIQTQPQINRNAIILPQMGDKNTQNKKQAIAKLQMSPNRSAKGRVANTPKAIQIKKSNIIKTDSNGKTVAQITNASVTNIRPSGTTQMENNNIVIQSAANPSTSQPIILQQVASANQGNILQYVTADGNNGLQYFTMPTNDYKAQQPTQYLTPNPLIPGTFQLQSDNNNLLLANTSSGLQVISNGALQLAQSQQQVMDVEKMYGNLVAVQPQVLGTLIQPQALNSTIQCGSLMSSEQMMLGATPSYEMVTNSLPGCMLLNNQPVYYGLETIVQNTVMQSQQFVSTAMQGVLSQNSSFSATTTQVFQASKIEPIVDMQQSYVVLNNDGTIMTPQTQQPLLTTANILQQAIPHMQSAQNPSWRFIDDKSNVFSTAANQNAPTIIQSQPQHVQNQSESIGLSQNVHQAPQPQQTVSVVQPTTVMQKVQPQKQTIKQPRQPKQTFNAKAMNKPTVKSSPIVVNEVKTQLKKIDVKQQLATKSMNESHITVKTADTLIKPAPKIATKPAPLIVGVTNEGKISSKTVLPMTQTPQRKLNAAKPIISGVKITSAAVKPKIISKTTVKQANNVAKALPAIQTQKAIVKDPLASQSISIPLQTYTISTSIPTAPKIIQESPNAPKSIEKQKPIEPMSTLNSATTLSSATNVSKTPICAFDNETVTTSNAEISTLKVNGNPFTAKVSNSLPTNAALQQNTSNTSTSQLTQPINSNIQPPTSQATTNTSNSIDNTPPKSYQFSTSLNSNQIHISLPTANSIQLPTAPYAPIYANGKLISYY